MSAKAHVLPSEVANERRMDSLRKPSVERILEILEKPRTQARPEPKKSLHSDKDLSLKGDYNLRRQSQDDRATAKDSMDSERDYRQPHDVVAGLSSK